MTLIIDNEAVKSVLTAHEVNDALEDAHRALSDGQAINSPPYRVLTPRDGADYGELFPKGGNPTHHSFTSLTGAISTLDITCDRVDSDLITYVRSGDELREVRVPGTADRKFCGLLYLYSSRTGELLAIIHDGYLQKFRVAGTGAVAAKYLSRPDSRILALIGSGWQASAAVECFADALSLTEIRVFSPTRSKRESFAAHWAKETNLNIIPVDSVSAATAGAQVVYTATNSPKPVVSASDLESGQFVTGVKDLEVELAGWERCDLLTVSRSGPMWQRYAIGGVEVIPEHGRDYWGQVDSSIEWDALPLLGDVITGRHPGRVSDSDVVGMFLRGDGVQFAAVGARILQLCQQAGLGTELPSELFLQDERYIP